MGSNNANPMKKIKAPTTPKTIPKSKVRCKCFEIPILLKKPFFFSFEKTRAKARRKGDSVSFKVVFN